MKPLTPILFSFSTGRLFPGFTDGSRWNGFLNVWVSVPTHEAVSATFTAEPEDVEAFSECEPDARGLVSYAHGFATTGHRLCEIGDRELRGQLDMLQALLPELTRTRTAAHALTLRSATAIADELEARRNDPTRREVHVTIETDDGTVVARSTLDEFLEDETNLAGFHDGRTAEEARDAFRVEVIRDGHAVVGGGAAPLFIVRCTSEYLPEVTP